jgi:cytochrome c1
MSQPLYEDLVEYADGTEASIEQMAEDVSSFMMWAAEPKLEQRKKMGFKVTVFLFVLLGLLYYSKKKIWARIDH